MFGSSTYILVAAASIVAGAAIALLCDRLGWSAFVAAGLALAAYVAIGLTLAIPCFTSGDTSLIASLGELARGPIAGWKDVVTLPLPLGEYGATLVPVLALLLVGTMASSLFAVRSRRWWGLAAVVTVVMVATAVLVGPAARAPEMPWAPYGVYVNREFLVGLATFALLLGWLGWRAWYLRRMALARAASGPHLTARAPRSFRWGVGCRYRDGRDRRRGRFARRWARRRGHAARGRASGHRPAPRRELDSHAACRVPQLLLRRAVRRRSVHRRRHGRGRVARARRYPSVLRRRRVHRSRAGGRGSTLRAGSLWHRRTRGRQAVSATVSLAAPIGVWVPLVGALGSVTFHGTNNGELVDSFFYQPDTQTGLVTDPGGLQAGDSYTLSAFVPASVPELAHSARHRAATSSTRA